MYRPYYILESARPYERPEHVLTPLSLGALGPWRPWVHPSLHRLVEVTDCLKDNCAGRWLHHLKLYRWAEERRHLASIFQTGDDDGFARVVRSIPRLGCPD